MYKFLRPGAVAPFSGFAWPQPEGGNPGAWVDTVSPLALCEHGVHACRIRDLPHWLADELWRVELEGEVVEQRDLVLAIRARLLARVDRWDHELARSFAEACAWQARDHAVATLSDAGLAAEAASLASAATVLAVGEAARAGHVAAAATGAERARSVAYAAMTTAEHAIVDPGVSAYVSWAAFAGYGAAVTAGLRVPHGDVAERERQAEWLAAELDLAV